MIHVFYFFISMYLGDVLENNRRKFEGSDKRYDDNGTLF